MQHGDYLIQILDERGNVIGKKPRRKIDKRADIVHCIDVFVIDQGRVALSQIAPGGLYGGLLSSSSATMLRQDEQPHQAAQRALEKELGLEKTDVVFLGKRFFELPDGIKRVKSIFWTQVNQKPIPNAEDIQQVFWMTPQDIHGQLAVIPHEFANSFKAIWGAYSTRLSTVIMATRK